MTELKQDSCFNEEIIKLVENKQEEIIPLLALTSPISSGTAETAITGGSKFKSSLKKE